MSRDQRPARATIVSAGNQPPARRRDDAVAEAGTPERADAAATSQGGMLKAIILLLSALIGGAGYVLIAPGARGADFAPMLANGSLPQQPGYWSARSRQSGRQHKRWQSARHAIAHGRGPEAAGWLDLMMKDEPDLGLVPAFRLGRGAALALSGRKDEARRWLADPALLRQPEACYWRLLAGDGPAATCALPAIRSRSADAATRARLAGASALIQRDQPAEALQWLASMGESDAEANLLRGRALLAVAERGADPVRQKHWQQRGLLRLARAEANGGVQTRYAARIDLAIARHRLGIIAAKAAQQQLANVAFRWRGGPLEWRALDAAARIAKARQQQVEWLGFAAARLRYGPADDAAKPLRLEVSAYLAAMPDRDVPLSQMAGIMWRYRDLLPADAQGIAAFEGLIARLDRAGLYGKAADLLDWRRRQSPPDIERGPLSLRIARYQLLAGAPQKALGALRNDARIAFPDAIAAERNRLEAIALWRMGAKEAALALLADVEGGTALSAEICWQAKDWEGWLAADARLGVPAGEARLIRRAVALAMTGDESGLAAMYTARRGQFAPGPARDAFDWLAGPQSPANTDELRTALAQLPVPDLPGDSAALLAAR